MHNPTLCIKDLVAEYETQNGINRVLDGINLTQKGNEWLGLIGPNSVGKTTLGLMIKGLLYPAKGSVSMFSKQPEIDLEQRKRFIGYLPSNPRDQVFGITVRDDIAFGLLQRNIPPQIINIKVNNALETLGILHLADHLTHKLSGSDLQKTALAGLIAITPKYLILDEPTTFLDHHSRCELLKIIKNLHNNGTGILYISTYWEEISMADKVAVLKNGKEMYTYTPQELLIDQKILLGAGILLPDINLLAKNLKKFDPLIRAEKIKDIEHIIDIIWSIKDRYKR